MANSLWSPCTRLDGVCVCVLLCGQLQAQSVSVSDHDVAEYHRVKTALEGVERSLAAAQGNQGGLQDQLTAAKVRPPLTLTAYSTADVPCLRVLVISWCVAFYGWAALRRRCGSNPSIRSSPKWTISSKTPLHSSTARARFRWTCRPRYGPPVYCHHPVVALPECCFRWHRLFPCVCQDPKDFKMDIMIAFRKSEKPRVGFGCTSGALHGVATG